MMLCGLSIHLMEKGHPFYKYYYGDVSEVIKINENKVKFEFSTNTNKELVLIVGTVASIT